MPPFARSLPPPARPKFSPPTTISVGALFSAFVIESSCTKIVLECSTTSLPAAVSSTPCLRLWNSRLANVASSNRIRRLAAMRDKCVARAPWWIDPCSAQWTTRSSDTRSNLAGFNFMSAPMPLHSCEASKPPARKAVNTAWMCSAPLVWTTSCTSTFCAANAVNARW